MTDITRMCCDLPINGDRLWADMIALGRITDPDRPYTRRSFSSLFLEGREWLRQRAEEPGIAMHLDAGGNMIGRMEGREPSIGTILIGSHSDTVDSGGRFDGVAGVISALEVLRSLREAGRTLRHAIEIVDFLAEEPSEYGLSCVGSRAMAGELSPDMLGYRDSKGEDLGDAIDRVGGEALMLESAKREDVAAFFELHIEQGAVLETSGVDLGIVTSVVGIARIKVGFSGRADHAGTTPMALRHDAGLAVARTIAFVADRAEACAAAGRGHFVGTAGSVEFAPNAPNVVPGEAHVVVDARGEDHALIREFMGDLERWTASIASECKVQRTTWNVLSDTKPVEFDPGLRDLLQESASDLGFSTLAMASGAGHDAAFMSRVAPSAMVFVPCREGRSHTPEEWAEPKAIAAGTAAIYEAVLRFDKLAPDAVRNR